MLLPMFTRRALVIDLLGYFLFVFFSFLFVALSLSLSLFARGVMMAFVANATRLCLVRTMRELEARLTWCERRRRDFTATTTTRRRRTGRRTAPLIRHSCPLETLQDAVEAAHEFRCCGEDT